MSKIEITRRNLPHIYISNSTYFITFRLKGTIPQLKLNELRNREELKRDFQTNKKEQYTNYEKYFEEYDKLLDSNKKIEYLKYPEIAEVVKQTLHYYDKKQYNLICYTIMPNHVHVVFQLLKKETQTGKSVLHQAEEKTVSKIMQSIKGYSAREANRILNKKGSFWQSESYDHIIRDQEELEKTIKYVIYNPVKAKLVDNYEDWQFTYLSQNWKK